MSWQPITTAPRDGTLIVCWAPGWEDPCFLLWKENLRISKARAQGYNVGDMADCYFGDPERSDDYHLSEPGGGPTYWHPLSPTPK